MNKSSFEESVNAISSEISFIRLSRQSDIDPYAALVRIEDAVREAQSRHIEGRHPDLVQNQFRIIAGIALAAMMKHGSVTRRDVANLIATIPNKK